MISCREMIKGRHSKRTDEICQSQLIDSIIKITAISVKWTRLHVVSMPITSEMASLHGRVVEGDRARDAGEHVAVGHFGSTMYLWSIVYCLETDSYTFISLKKGLNEVSRLQHDIVSSMPPTFIKNARC